jgi:TetR/AcrR family transcriptional repressor of lmrAB and yxaGH operons
MEETQPEYPKDRRMPATPKHRNAIVNAAATLFRRQGYAATGINQIADAAGAPKGSLYHYFPKGKDEIGEAAVRFAGARVARTLEQLSVEHSSTASLMKAYGRLLVGWMAESGFSDGCPITTTLLETAPASPPITAAGREAFGSWRDVLVRSLIRDGFPNGDARRMATLAIASLEGALILARVEQNARPINEVFDALADVLRDDGITKLPTRSRRSRS